MSLTRTNRHTQSAELFAAGVLVNEGELLVSQIRRLSGLRYRPLAFTRELETQFQQTSRNFRKQRLWLEGLGAIGLYVLFCLLKTHLFAHPGRADLVLRLGVVLPLALLVNAAMRKDLPAWLQEAAVLAVACLAGSVELVLSVRESAVAQAYAQFAVIAVLVFTQTLMRLRFPFALAATAWAVLAEGLFMASCRGLGSQDKALGLSLTLIISIVALIANYSLGREERLAFLRMHHKETLVGELARTNQNLATVAHTDGLTGLANRAALNAHLALLWNDLQDKGGTLSAILVDVDHFKALNDQFGHLYGDKVLVRVARLMAEALRREDDYIARFGGEEFVILLPNTPLHLALLVAERLRGLVELAGLPAMPGHEPRLRGKRATVSCGVAAAAANSGSSALDLIHAADEALYSAKRAGRNLVRLSMMGSSAADARSQTYSTEEFAQLGGA